MGRRREKRVARAQRGAPVMAEGEKEKERERETD